MRHVKAQSNHSRPIQKQQPLTKSLENKYIISISKAHIVNKYRSVLDNSIIIQRWPKLCLFVSFFSEGVLPFLDVLSCEGVWKILLSFPEVLSCEERNLINPVFYHEGEYHHLSNITNCHKNINEKPRDKRKINIISPYAGKASR